ncbi:hypothetical protein AA11237_0429 [Acidocella aminolytica 101 = DSM 11237]|jgi:hypothetical protein|nr:hypothetical protein AA11237_0429 [Acidocella aminolytica 101 = DSM 11237]
MALMAMDTVRGAHIPPAIMANRMGMFPAASSSTRAVGMMTAIRRPHRRTMIGMMAINRHRRPTEAARLVQATRKMGDNIINLAPSITRVKGSVIKITIIPLTAIMMGGRITGTHNRPAPRERRQCV